MNRKRLSALLIVALIAAVPLTVSIPQTDADVSPSRFADLPRYGYVLTMADGQVDSVVTYENSYSDTPVVKSGLGDWSFINGLGPFNSFYAAINLVDDPNDELEACGESRISRIAGKVAYILNPDDLSKTLGGNSYTGSYNIMFVIPTVYWFADGNVLYLSNDPAFFGSPTTVDDEQRMGAYAHTVTNVANGTATVYDCLCLGVYEASSIALGGKQTLISQSGAVPFTQNNLANLRSKAINNNAYSDGIYGLWNYYHWTLFKMMSYTVMCDKNSKAMVGNGVINSSSLNNTGGTDADGWYSGTTSDETTSSKLFLENVWGNIAEYLDNVYMDGEGKLYAGDGLGSGVDIAIDYSSTKLAGKDHINGKQTLVDTFERIKNNYSSSYDPIAWDSPEITSDAVNPSGDSVCIKHGRTIPTCLSVGGSRLWTDRFNNIGSSGLSSISATLSSSESTIKLGSRLAYLMNMDAIGIHRVVYESTEGGTVSGPDRFAEGETVSLTVDCDIDFRLSCLTYSYYADTGVQTADITNAKEFVMPSASVTVRAVFERVVTITVDGSPVNGRITADPDSLSFNVSAGASFSAQRNTLTIFDSDGSTHTLTATADRNHHFYGFMDSDYRFITNGCFFISTVITAKFVTWVPVYQVEFYETDHRITTLYVDRGDMVIMPEPIAQEGKDFAGWYSDSSFTQYVGPQCTYYGPNGDNERIRLYARFIDIVGPVNSDYQVSCQFVLDGGNAAQTSTVVDAVFNDSISGSSSGILVLSPKSGSSGYYVHTVEAVNATVVKINDTSWIYSNATGPVMLTVYSTLVSERGVQSLYITGVTGDSTGVRVRIDPSTIAGLPEGRFSVRGIAYQTFDNGFVGYANIATDKRTIMEGTEICDVVMSGIVDPGFRLYYAYVLLEYGTYDVSNDTYSNEQVSVAIMAPAVV